MSIFTCTGVSSSPSLPSIFIAATSKFSFPALNRLATVSTCTNVKCLPYLPSTFTASSRTSLSVNRPISVFTCPCISCSFDLPNTSTACLRTYLSLSLSSSATASTCTDVKYLPHIPSTFTIALRQFECLSSKCLISASTYSCVSCFPNTSAISSWSLIFLTLSCFKSASISTESRGLLLQPPKLIARNASCRNGICATSGTRPSSIRLILMVLTVFTSHKQLAAKNRLV